MVSAVQQQLIDRLAKLRYNPPPTTQAQRPKKKDKLPAGEAYTCGRSDVGEQPLPATRRRTRRESSNSDSSVYSHESSGEEDRRQAVGKILKKLGEKRPHEEEEEESLSEEDEEAAEEIEQEEEQGGKDLQEKQLEAQVQVPASVYLPGSYIVALYQGDWYVGQLMDKNGEPEAEEGEEYLLVNFMERTGGDYLKWPARLDILNTLKDDVLFSCLPPTPCAATSSSRTFCRAFATRIFPAASRRAPMRSSPS